LGGRSRRGVLRVSDASTPTPALWKPTTDLLRVATLRLSVRKRLATRYEKPTGKDPVPGDVLTRNRFAQTRGVSAPRGRHAGSMAVFPN